MQIITYLLTLLIYLLTLLHIFIIRDILFYDKDPIIPVIDFFQESRYFIYIQIIIACYYMNIFHIIFSFSV